MAVASGLAMAVANTQHELSPPVLRGGDFAQTPLEPPPSISMHRTRRREAGGLGYAERRRCIGPWLRPDGATVTRSRRGCGKGDSAQTSGTRNGQTSAGMSDVIQLLRPMIARDMA